MPFQNNVPFKTPQSSQILNCGEIVCAKAASTAKSNWNDEDGIGHERERSGAGTAAVPPPPAIQSSQFGNRVNLIWLALGIQYICIPFIFLYGYYYTYMVEKHVKRVIFECIKDHSY